MREKLKNDLLLLLDTYVDANVLRGISKERTEGGLNKRATFGALLFSTLLVFPN